MAFNLADYETVESRLEKFWKEYPDGRIAVDIHSPRNQEGSSTPVTLYYRPTMELKYYSGVKVEPAEFKVLEKEPRYFANGPDDLDIEMSETRKNQPLSDESRQKMSRAKKGRPRTEETKRRISVTLTGRPKSEESRKKLSETRKGNNNASKLTDVQRLEIVQRRKNGESTLKLATEFGVTQRTIYNCCKPQF